MRRHPGPHLGVGSVTSSAPAASAAWTGQVGAPTRMLLLRHGQTPLSVERRYSGHGDPELTDLGRAQAALRRTRATAQAVADATGAPLVVRDGLIETNFGTWDGLTFAEARDLDPDAHARWLGSQDVAPPGGESFAQVGARVSVERDAILAEYPASTVVVVSHVTPIKLLLQQALGAGPSILYRLHLDTASLSIADFYPDGGTSVRLVNDTSHLPS
ncbi:MAG: phosphoglycerate kinase [Pseudonocardia sp. SCN 72-86]|nr:MAG: phosphoglycerate kinase [Pseudonocardia sp. SCN 72-86]